MQWFKHDSNATSDAKIKKLIKRFGVTGYAIYFHCLELIAGDISENNINFELEHDSEIIADNLRIVGTSEKSGIQIVEEIMRFIVELQLFDEKDGHIFCFKMLKRVDTSMTSNVRFRQIIKNAHIRHDSIMLDKNRVDKKKIYNNGTFKKPTVMDIQGYLDELNFKGFTGQYFFNQNESKGWVVGKNRSPMKDWKAAVRTWIEHDKKINDEKKQLTQKEASIKTDIFCHYYNGAWLDKDSYERIMYDKQFDKRDG